jgi:hypothetical protein
MKFTLASASLVALATLLATPARADVAPPETEPCQGKTTGDACVYNGSGTCQTQTCSKLDYAHWDRDASSSPPSATYACLKCIAGTTMPTSTATSTATDTDTATATATATTSTTATATPTATATTSTTATQTDSDPPPAKDDSACSIGKQVTAKRVAPWLLAGAFSLLFVFARRRRQS